MSFTKFDTSTIRTSRTMKPGYIFRTEYGDYNNWVNFVYEKSEIIDNTWVKTTVHYVDKDESFEVFHLKSEDTYEVIGEEEKEKEE